MKTYSQKASEVQRDWYVVDATGKTLGRLSSELARRLRGKHKPEFTPHVDTGDFVVIVNADKVHLDQAKATAKMHYTHTGYPGGIKAISDQTSDFGATDFAISCTVPRSCASAWYGSTAG